MLDVSESSPRSSCAMLICLPVLVTIGLFLVSVMLFIVRPTEKASNEFVWKTFLNYTGWPDGVCFLSAQLTTCFIYAGLDGALHLAEDALNPRVVVPRATLTTISIGFGTAFAYTIAMLYSISDFEAILSLEGFVVPNHHYHELTDAKTAIFRLK